MAEKSYEKETKEEFSSRLFEIIGNSYTTIAIAFGIRSGLFDVLVGQENEPLTSQELADKAKLKERYVREWLGAMASAHIIDIDPTSKKFSLPAHRISSFTAGSKDSSASTFAKCVPVVSGVFEAMLKAAKIDGPRGLTVEETADFDGIEEEDSSLYYRHVFVDEFVPSVPGLAEKLERGVSMLDVGCGRGLATKLLAERYPKSTFTGLDMRQDTLDFATNEARKLNLTNVEYVCADASQLPNAWSGKFDIVFFFNVLHDLARPDLVVANVKRVMKKDGWLSVTEFNCHSDMEKNVANPAGSFLYTYSLFYCLPVAYNFPGSLGIGLMWGTDKIEEFLKENGFAVKAVTPTPLIDEVHFLCELQE